MTGSIFSKKHARPALQQGLRRQIQGRRPEPGGDEDGISPFDYDVIVNGQDACPLQDLSIESGQPVNNATEVTVKFKAATCMEGAPNKDDFTTVRFEVIEENGKSVIDDIMVHGEGGLGPTSLKEIMVLIARGQ